MGNGIAQVCAVAVSVVMVDISTPPCSGVAKTVAGSLDRLVKKDKISAETRPRRWPASGQHQPTPT
jgi:3-hydroxybutyryl-CoA dehydrogenase